MVKKIIQINSVPAFYDNISTRTASGLAAYLNSLPTEEAFEHLKQYKNTVHIQEILPYDIGYVDDSLDIVLMKPDSKEFICENLDVLLSYIKFQNSLLSCCSSISLFPEFVRGMLILFSCIHKDRHALIARISLKSKYYVVLLPTDETGKMPTAYDSEYRWEIYHDGENEFFFFDDGDYDFEECVNRILMAEMVGMHDLDV